MPRSPLEDFLDHNDERVTELIERYATYQPRVVDKAKIAKWLLQFDIAHYDIFLRLLESVNYYSEIRLNGLLQALHLHVIARLSTDGIISPDRIFFIPGGGAGKSAGAIATSYRRVNNLANASFNFTDLSQLTGVRFIEESNGLKNAYVFLDDFIGTGDQFSDFWNDTLSQFLPPTAEMYFATALSSDTGHEYIEKYTPFKVISVNYLQEQEFLLSHPDFDGSERTIIEDYCNRVKNLALGHGDLAVLIAFAYGPPDNTVAVLRGDKKQRSFKGILPRFDDL
jgi:hypothetical protein